MASICSKDVTIEDLPMEILELILSFISPYQDFKPAMLVCQKWHTIIQGISQRHYIEFEEAIQTGHIKWQHPTDQANVTITERYSHSACYHNKSVYIFGGCTLSNTTFNDLWRFDLGTRKWIRPVALGSYPSPKACASLVAYEDCLLLFGGWSHPIPYPLHQTPQFFNQLHAYYPKTNRWVHILPQPSVNNIILSPPGMAGHMSSVVGDNMIVFGGSSGHDVASSNDVWLFHIPSMVWSKADTTETKPPRRYGHSQLVLDSNHILIVGGCGGANMQFNDVWLLNMTESVWTWKEVTILNPELAPQPLWCHTACKVANTVAVFSKSPHKPPVPVFLWPNPDKSRPRPHRSGAAVASSSNPDTSESSGYDESSSDTDNDQQRANPSRHHGMPAVRPNASKNRQRQLENLRKYEARLKGLTQKNNPRAVPPPCNAPDALIKYQSVMYLHRLDITHVMDELTATWQQLVDEFDGNAAEETIFYSLVCGRGELIFFGGIPCDLKSMSVAGSFQSATKQVHIVTFPRKLK